MRKISAEKIIAVISRLCIQSNCQINEDLITSLKHARGKEQGRARMVLASILKNIKIAQREKLPVCQDTGMAIVFLEIGDKLKIDLGEFLSLSTLVQEGVRRGYQSGYLRKSIVEPLSRVNTEDNTPAIIREKIVAGNRLKIKLLIKGFGAENMAKTSMLRPDAGEAGIKRFTLDSVKKAGSHPCPPMVIGIGIGGTMQKAVSLAEEALLEPVKSKRAYFRGCPGLKSKIKRLEEELLREINQLNIGPAGLGGETTALSVKIKTFPTHIAGLPVAVNISCWANRHQEIIL